ncbi:MAG TPA: exodeoxyribonuclease VII small subunit [Candidatus Kapabacteria bacterium]|nr:exodeoxyribonuclease VII small subunit [Candidatus Kapabacteria bacterium]
MAKKSEKITFESQLKRLEEIVGLLDEGDVPLDRTLELYEEGVTLAKACAEKLSQVEKKLQQLSKNSDGLFTVTEIEDDEQ